MNPWTIQRWLTSLNVRCLLVENVPEFTDWGPLQDDDRPDPNRKGLYFQEWVRSLWGLGYNAEWRLLNAADYGDATTRVRFFLQARNDGHPVRWPEPTHSKTGAPTMLNHLPKWRGAKEIIDWSNPGRSLLDDPKYVKKPLSEKTRQRIAKGLDRYGGPLAHLYVRLLDLPEDIDPVPADGETEPFILNRHGENGADRAHPVDQPIPTATTRGAGYLVNAQAEPITEEPRPVLESFHGSDRQHTVPLSTDEPVHTVTTITGGCLYLVKPQAEPFIGANRTHNTPRFTDDPIPPATSAHGGGTFLVEPDLHPFLLGQQSGGAPRTTEEPVPTVASDGAIALVRPTVIEYYGQSDARDIAQPVSTIVSNRKHALVNPTLVKYYGQSHSSDVGQPVPGLTTKARYALANPTLIEVNHGDHPDSPGHESSRTHSVEEPLGTVTTIRNTALAEPVLVQTGQTGGNGNYARSTDSPVPTITTKNDVNVATPTLEHWDKPLRMAREANIDPRRLVLLDGHPWLLDIRFRMLQNSELARAMSFEDEETSYEFIGNVSEVTKQIGNAVPVRLAKALIKTVLTKEPDQPLEE